MQAQAMKTHLLLSLTVLFLPTTLNAKESVSDIYAVVEVGSSGIKGQVLQMIAEDPESPPFKLLKLFEPVTRTPSRGKPRHPAKSLRPSLSCTRKFRSNSSSRRTTSLSSEAAEFRLMLDRFSPIKYWRRSRRRSNMQRPRRNPICYSGASCLLTG